MTDTPPGLEYDEIEKGLVGRDPRKMTLAEIEDLGHERQPLRKVIRAKCLDCCAGQQAEVRRCVATDCALWPYRTNSNPFAGREMTDEQREAAAERLRSARAAAHTKETQP